MIYFKFNNYDSMIFEKNTLILYKKHKPTLIIKSFFTKYEYAYEAIKASKDYIFLKEDEEIFKKYVENQDISEIMKAESLEDLKNILTLREII